MWKFYRAPLIGGPPNLQVPQISGALKSRWVLCSNRTFPQPQRGKMSLWRFSQVLMDPCCQGELGIRVLSSSRSIYPGEKTYMDGTNWPRFKVTNDFILVYKLTQFPSLNWTHSIVHFSLQVDLFSMSELTPFTLFSCVLKGVNHAGRT